MYEFKPLSVVRENIVLKVSALMVCNYDVDVFKEALLAMVVICKHRCNLVCDIPFLFFLSFFIY